MTEAMLRYRLPPIFREWIISYNGGWPDPDGFEMKENPYSKDDMVDVFLGFYSDSIEHDILCILQSEIWLSRQNIFPVAIASSSSYLGLNMKNNDDHIYMVDILDEGDNNGFRNMILVSNSIESFVDELF